MKQCIEHLREGWYGGAHEPNVKAFEHMSYDDLWSDETNPAKATHIAKANTQIVVEPTNCPGICAKILKNATPWSKCSRKVATRP